jgi:hypothetical protein
MKRFGEDQFKVGDFCQKTKCQFTKNGKKILVLTARNKISEICKDEFDLVVNLTGKYQLPDCLKTQQKIDNFDFYKRGTQEIFLNK